MQMRNSFKIIYYIKEVIKIKKNKKFIITTLIILIILECFNTLVFGVSNKKIQINSVTENHEDVDLSKYNITSLYCWDIDDFNLSKLKDEVEYLGINTLYIQRPSNASQTDRLKQVMEFAKRYNLDVFLLEGARDWLTTGEINNVTTLIDQAYELNQILDYKIKGVSLDVEFYLTDDYQSSSTERQQELFKIFTENTKKCCDYANGRGLGYSMALPVWLDKLSEEELENLMNYNYDHIAFMNYYKETIMDNMNEEIEIAKKHNIKIVSIAEVQNPEFGTVGEEDTFYYDGLQNCINTLKAIRQKYNYEKLGISYHYYKPLLDLLERDTEVGIENKYELEICPYIDGKSIDVDEATISSNDEIFKSIYGYYSKEGKYVINFYGLEYGKEYTVTIKSGNYIGTRTFIYQKGDDNFDKIEITHMEITLIKQQSSEIEQEGNKPSQQQPSEKEPEENKPNQQQPSKVEQGENKPSEQQPSKTRPEENNDDTTIHTELPNTGEHELTGKLLIGFLIFAVILAIINIRYQIIIK